MAPPPSSCRHGSAPSRQRAPFLGLLALALACGGDPEALPSPGRGVVLASGAIVTVVERGAGEPIVLVHGLPGSASDWEALAPILVEHARVISYDRVGHAFSSRRGPGADHGLVQNARELGELLDALDLESATIVGWSTGGAIAQVFAARWPERVDRLVLVATDAPGAGYPPDDLRWTLLSTRVGAELARALISLGPLGRALVRSDLAAAWGGPDHVPEEVVARTHALLALPGAFETFVAESLQYDESLLEPDAVLAPTLIVHGGLDAFLPLGLIRALDEALPDSRRVEILDATHMLPVTHAERLAVEIRRFTRSRD